MCGSGTLAVEAALIASRRAPGLSRTRWGFSRWPHHDAALFRRLVDEARAQVTRFDGTIYAADASAEAVGLARENARNAQVEIRFAVGALDGLQAPAPTGLLACNPPYGERLGEDDSLGPLYALFGDVLRRRFLGWRAAILTTPHHVGEIGLRPQRRTVLWNGPIECRLADFEISSEAPKEKTAAWKKIDPDPGIAMFENRLRKNWKRFAPWAAQEQIHAYRVYDADLPEYACAVDLYEDALCIQEYAFPKTVNERRARARLHAILEAAPRVLDLAPERTFLKVRRKQSPDEQYGKLSDAHFELEVREGGLRFIVNLSDYLDTGLFLDHRKLRALVGKLAANRDVLNLFCYTASASVYAAAGGAASTTSVDLSNTYLGWAERNFQLNRMRGRLVQADCLDFVDRCDRQFGLIFCDPPTFTNSKRMQRDFDLGRDHVWFLNQLARLLKPDGIIVFSNHFQRFKMDREALTLASENISKKTLPRDFERNLRIHNSWLLKLR
jgi:23S rRNA (guanine2445-N2)-methyltransferase / 23S rRNA (guanine2069-N7)-methyltransferase